MNGEMLYTCDACHNKQDGRLSFCEECGYDTLTKKPTPLAVAGEPVAASGKAAAWECRVMLRGGTRSEWHKCSREQYDSIRLTGHYNGPGGAPCECRALYLHPATVTDEDVERALVAFYDATEQSGEAVAMRAALESFANKEPTDE